MKALRCNSYANVKGFRRYVKVHAHITYSNVMELSERSRHKEQTSQIYLNALQLTVQ